MYFTDFPQGHSQDFYCVGEGAFKPPVPRPRESKASRPCRRRGAEGAAVTTMSHA